MIVDLRQWGRVGGWTCSTKASFCLRESYQRRRQQQRERQKYFFCTFLCCHCMTKTWKCLKLLAKGPKIVGSRCVRLLKVWSRSNFAQQLSNNMQQGVQTDGKCNFLALSLILVPLRRFPSTSWSIHFGDVSKANAQGPFRQKQNALLFWCEDWFLLLQSHRFI